MTCLDTSETPGFSKRFFRKSANSLLASRASLGNCGFGVAEETLLGFDFGLFSGLSVKEKEQNRYTIRFKKMYY